MAELDTNLGVDAGVVIIVHVRGGLEGIDRASQVFGALDAKDLVESLEILTLGLPAMLDGKREQLGDRIVRVHDLMGGREFGQQLPGGNILIAMGMFDQVIEVDVALDDGARLARIGRHLARWWTVLNSQYEGKRVW